MEDARGAASVARILLCNRDDFVTAMSHGELNVDACRIAFTHIAAVVYGTHCGLGADYSSRAKPTDG